MEKINIGKLEKGKLNKITDVKGVRVGHVTVEEGDTTKTGVTVVLPCEDNIFLNKMVAASFVINGFGKSVGLMQIEELGTLESPIALTNTLNVGLVQDGLIEYMIAISKKENEEIKSINTVVCECNDSRINDITKRAVKQHHVIAAIENATEDFSQGAVGAGRATVCHGFKGGIGSSSRVITLDDNKYTIGVMVQSNYGAMADLLINGKPVGKKAVEMVNDNAVVDKGSIIIIVATDLPCSQRQLKRIIKRCSVGLARMGSFTGNGSGEVVIGFTTQNRISHYEKKDIILIKALNENKIDLCFRAVAEATEEAVLNSMLRARSEIGLDSKVYPSLNDFSQLF